jgi:hypothetical protein
MATSKSATFISLLARASFFGHYFNAGLRPAMRYLQYNSTRTRFGIFDFSSNDYLPLEKSPKRSNINRNKIVIAHHNKTSVPMSHSSSTQQDMEGLPVDILLLVGPFHPLGEGKWTRARFSGVSLASGRGIENSMWLRQQARTLPNKVRSYPDNCNKALQQYNEQRDITRS